jgi:hypothetical protein
MAGCALPSAELVMVTRSSGSSGGASCFAAGCVVCSGGAEPQLKKAATMNTAEISLMNGITDASSREREIDRAMV